MNKKRRPIFVIASGVKQSSSLRWIFPLFKMTCLLYGRLDCFVPRNDGIVKILSYIEVLLIGNPSTNPGIWQLYTRYIVERK